MIEQEAVARVMLVRAVEETLPQQIMPELLLEARIRAGEPPEGEAWIARRATHLVEHALAPYEAVLSHSELALPSPWLLIVLAFLLGLGSNYLGPSAKIHVFWNPISVLIGWNILIYALLIATSVVSRSRVSGQKTPEIARPISGESPPVRRYRSSFLDRLILGRVVMWFLRVQEGVEEVREQGRDIGAVSQRFAVL